ncbi:MAG: pyridoxamine 5'-phosphate oxidase [Phycisphaerae bacterium]|nr:pyridoxamine 5'-phosphate oxidase [Phycisphaerae bacterium]
MDLNALGTEFVNAPLNRRDLLQDPFDQFESWMACLLQARAVEPNAMTLSTVNTEGQPSSRIVYLKAVDRQGFVLFTNYQSQKSVELARNPKAALTFFWPQLNRQVRIEGTVQKTSEEESDGYFARRSRASQLGAWASQQSQRLTSRDALDDQFKAMEKRFPQAVPRPPHWGGYRLSPDRMEFWHGRLNRCHDRFEYRSTSTGWTITRLSP